VATAFASAVGADVVVAEHATDVARLTGDVFLVGLSADFPERDLLTGHVVRA
jgi:hypothetical protein